MYKYLSISLLVLSFAGVSAMEIREPQKNTRKHFWQLWKHNAPQDLPEISLSDNSASDNNTSTQERCEIQRCPRLTSEDFEAIGQELSNDHDQREPLHRVPALIQDDSKKTIDWLDHNYKAR